MLRCRHMLQGVAEARMRKATPPSHHAQRYTRTLCWAECSSQTHRAPLSHTLPLKFTSMLDAVCAAQRLVCMRPPTQEHTILKDLNGVLLPVGAPPLAPCILLVLLP